MFAKEFGLAGDDLWVRADDGRLLHFNARTGARAGRASSAPGRANLAVIAGAGVVVGNEDGTLTRVDASTGRALWSVRLADTPPAYTERDRTLAIVGSAVWALSEDSVRGTERLTAVDLASGKTLSTTALKDAGAAGSLMPIAGELWFTTPTQAVVVKP